MTDRANENRTGPIRHGLDVAAQANRLVNRALTRARWALLWERVWPAFCALAAVIGLFAAASWAGLWLSLPPLARIIGLGVSLAALLSAGLLFLRVRWPSAEEALRRLDRASGLPHRPATAIADDMAIAGHDQVTLALWQAHIERAARAARALKAGLPHPRLFDRDPYALRALVLILLVPAFFAASGERIKRIAAAFDWAGAVASTNFRVDAWVAPPLYTGRPPLILPGIRPGDRAAAIAPQSVPVGSILVIRATGDVRLDVETSGGLAPVTAESAPRPPAGTEDRRYRIGGDGAVKLGGLAGTPVWNFIAVPDRAPTISLAKDPEPQARGALQLTYKLDDDYGVTAAEAKFALKSGVAEGVSGAPRPLYGPPDFALVLPQARTRNGVAQSMKVLTEHPWAGAEVELTLLARDEAENEGRSEPHVFTLPERNFTKPLARALIEQRRILALDARAKPRVLTALDALAIAPEVFGMEWAVYLGLRTAFWQLTLARSDDSLREVVARLWSMAVMIEDGNVSGAEQALRAAQDALRQALDRGANDEEIRRLMDQLRAAMDKFLQALAEEMRKNPQQLARPLDRNARELRPQDLKSMLDRLERLARSGAKDAARQLLDELRSMMENLQMAQPGMSPDDDDMSALDELGDMIRKQQQLRDRTFQQGQQRRGDRQRGQRGQPQQEQGEEGAEQPGFDDLKGDQQALREQLNRLLNELRQRGQLGQQGQQGQQGQGQQGQGQQGQRGQRGQGAEGLGRAEEAMRDAEGALGQGDAPGAVDSQGRALEALRQGAQSLAQQMQQGGSSPGPGQPGRTGPARAQQETDPLGRPLRGRDYGDDATVKVPGEIDVQRARRIIEELRRRFGDQWRPQEELDYIERLLRDF